MLIAHTNIEQLMLLTHKLLQHCGNAVEIKRACIQIDTSKVLTSVLTVCLVCPHISFLNAPLTACL